MPTAINQGIKIFYQVDGEGPPLVLLGGFPGSTADMYDFGYVENLKQDFKIILIDPRGFGQSDKPHEAAQYSMQLFVDDIMAVLNQLSIEKCHVYGHSMGGWFAYGLAKYYPNRLNSLIISDGVPGYGDPELIREVLGKFDEFVQSIGGLTAAPKERWLKNDLEALAAIGDWVEQDIQSIIQLVDTVIDDIRVPCLVLMSNLPEDSDEFKLLNKTAATVPHAQSEEFNELSHLELYFRSDLVLPKIKEFLQKINDT
ncbi:MAG: alpha/beta hydrolase [Anaerolineae bacterium]|nr:alpha/beta hydrolase [Anaerolineae bacterium]